MPTIAVVVGVTIRMYYDDHVPPHFHAYYGGHHATFLLDGTMEQGALPRAVARTVRDWARRHRDELAVNWTHVAQGQLPSRIVE